MPLPSLPLDVWFRIATFMDAASLSALSEVNQALNDITMDKTHFQRLLPVPQTHHTPLLQLYRRMSALHHPPNHLSTTILSTKLKMVCVTQDLLLLLDVEKRRFIAFPSGLTIEAEDILGTRRSKIRCFMFHNLENRVLCLPGGLVAFQCGVNGTRLAILDTNNGEVFSHKLRRRRKPNLAIVHGKSLLVAGNNAEWILYRVDETTVEIKDWRHGTVVREINLSNEDTRFVIGECPAIDGSSVVGLAVKKMSGSVNEIHVKGFDDVQMMFRVDEGKIVNSVLRSIDKQTHVLITANGPLCMRPTGFIAHRKYEDAEKWWGGAFRFGGMLYPELKENGRVISVTRRPFLAQSRYGLRCWQSPGCPLWIDLKDGAAKWCTTQETCVPALKGRFPVWIRRMRGGGLAIMTKRSQGLIELVQFERDGENVKEKLLKSWTIQNLTNVCVVADHFVVATSDDSQMQLGKLHLLHFDKFCSGGDGVYECPLVGLLTYCYFPEDIREREPYQPNKKRRISDGSGQESNL